jgi:hypothetical protein
VNDAGREALWSVAAARLPVYLFVFGVVIVVAMVMAVLTATGSSAEAVFAAASQIASAGAAAATIFISMEGLIMGATKVFFERAKERARQEGRQEVRRQWEAWREENVNAGRDVPELPAEPSETRNEQNRTE